MSTAVLPLTLAMHVQQRDARAAALRAFTNPDNWEAALTVDEKAEIRRSCDLAAVIREACRMPVVPHA